MTSKTMTICHLNIRSLRNKIDELIVFLEAIGNPDIVCLTECRLKEDELKLAKVNKYILTDYYSRSEDTGGGVAIFVQECYNFKIKKTGIPKISSDFEYASVTLTVSEKLDVNVVCFYRAPKYDRTSMLMFFQNLENLLSKVNTIHPIFICGDFNINLDTNISDCLKKKNAADLLNVFNMFGLKQCIYDYTRVQEGTKSIIDNIFSNVDLTNLAPEVIKCDLSDHYMQMICFNYGYECNRVSNELDIYKRDYKNKYNISYFKHLISIEEWVTVDFSENVELAFDNFLTRFAEIVDVAFPLYKIKQKSGHDGSKNKKHKSWVSKEIIIEGKFIREMFKLTVDNPAIKKQYNLMKNNHKKNIAYTKKKYYSTKMIESSNKNTTAWQIIKDNYNTVKSGRFPDKFVNENGSKVNHIKDAAQEFNRYFLESIKEITDSMNIDPNIELNINCPFNMFLAPLMKDDVTKMIKTVSKKDSAGFDEIPCSLLSHIVETIADPLCKLINLSFIEGTFPSSLKKAVLVPIHKKNDKELISNYRAISLLSVFSKLLEVAYACQLKSFLNLHNIISNSQYGFREGHSTQDAVTSLYMYLLNNMDKSKKCECLFFDMSRAFDTVNHEILLNKMFAYGIRGVPNSWVKSYLSNRTQRVDLKLDGVSHQSDISAVPTGVPQGSTLGPILFLIFVNDLQAYVNTTNEFHVTQFADDVAIASVADSVQELSRKANVCTTRMDSYCTDFGLKLNGTKTQMMMFANKTPNHSLLVKIDNVSIRNSDSVRLLGILVDYNLNWYSHVESTTKKISVKCFVVRQLRTCVSLDVLKTYYFAHVQSILNYGILCWGNSSRINDLFKMQKKIIRIMMFKHPTYSCRDLFVSLKILTVSALYILACCIFVKTNIDRLTQFSDRNIKYNFRSVNNILLPQHKLSAVSNGVSIMPIKIYNHLPNQLKEITSLKLFKIKLKKILSEKPLYSLEEYFSISL